MSVSYLHKIYFRQDDHSHNDIICRFYTLALLNSVHFKFILSEYHKSVALVTSVLHCQSIPKKSPTHSLSKLYVFDFIVLLSMPRQVCLNIFK